MRNGGSSLEQASRELAALDPVMRGLYRRHGPVRLPQRGGDHFSYLVRAIVYQQLAGRAAATIHGRLLGLFDGGLSAAAVLECPAAALRGAGLSRNKLLSIQDLARQVADGRLALARIGRRSDERIVAELSAVRGIGRWTAEMFLIFKLRRPDVWPVLDLGVRKGYQRAYRKRALPPPRELERAGARFRPYRSLAAWYLWRAADGDAWEDA